MSSTITSCFLGALQSIVETIEAFRLTAMEMLTGEPTEYFLPPSEFELFKAEYMPSTAPSSEVTETIAEIVAQELIPRARPRIYGHPKVDWEKNFRVSWDRCRDRSPQVKLSLTEFYATITIVPTMMNRLEDISRSIENGNHDEACSQIIDIFKIEELNKKSQLSPELQQSYMHRWSPELNGTSPEGTV